MENNKPYGTVLIKASFILDFLVDNSDANLQEIAKGTTLTNSTALKILETLGKIGYVQKTPDKTYRLGTKLARYANKSLEQTNLIELTQPFLEALQEQIDETIHLGILSNQEIVYINKLEPKNQAITMSSRVGIARPLYSSAMGKAVLAEFSHEQYEDYLASHPLVPFTENTITNSIKLANEIAEAHHLKIAFDNEEMEKEIFCIGASIVQDQKVIGAFSVSMPKYRTTPKLIDKLIKDVKQTKEQIENIMQ
ncbi:IclR family transcriptional regulator [Enterococcus sp. LJL90]